MPSWKPLKRRELIAALRRAGFSGPYSGGRHEFMQKGDLVLTIPNPHPPPAHPALPARTTLADRHQDLMPPWDKGAGTGQDKASWNSAPPDCGTPPAPCATPGK